VRVIGRTLYNIDEAAAVVGDKALVGELIEFHGLRMYYRFQRVSAEHMDNGSFCDSLCSSGGHALAKWTYLKRKPNPADPEENTDRYWLTGWFQLDQEASMRLFSGRTVSSLIATSFKDGEAFGMFHSLEIEQVHPEHARFLVADIAQIQELTSARNSVLKVERSLDLRERTTLLTIIGALADEAKLDLSHPHTAGQALEKILDAKGVKISARTIGEHLKAVHEAMDSRKA
jgi:hypothetical protein